MLRHIVLMWFALFSLSPCTVKEALFHTVNTDYAKPFNKSKTTAPANSCAYPHAENLQISVVSKSKTSKQVRAVAFSPNLNYEESVVRTSKNASKTYSGNSPPKYILYKRLKIDIA